MINRRLTAAEAAERLGVKPATLYSYVSRGLLDRERTPSGSTFDMHEVAHLARTSRRPLGAGRHSRRLPPAEGAPTDEPIFVTELTLIEGGRLYYRGLDAVDLSRQRRFEEVAAWLWTGEWPDDQDPWDAPPAMVDAVVRAVNQLGPGSLPIERFTVGVMAASLSDPLRHDLGPSGVPVTGRGLLAALVQSLPERGAAGAVTAGGRSISGRLWTRLTALPLTEARRAVLEAALVLVADHELAPSTLAARVAAAFRADPYAVVTTGLGPASGGWPSGSSGAPTEVETLLVEAAGIGAEAAIGARIRRTGTTPHGFGMPLYPDGDPRGAELLRRIEEVAFDRDRLQVVQEVLAVARRRAFPPPNVDLGLGALAFCSDMLPGAGQAVSTFGKMAGWLAHTAEEYANPTRFRSRADYVGIRPESPPGTEESVASA